MTPPLRQQFVPGTIAVRRLGHSADAFPAVPPVVRCGVSARCKVSPREPADTLTPLVRPIGPPFSLSLAARQYCSLLFLSSCGLHNGTICACHFVREFITTDGLSLACLSGC